MRSGSAVTVTSMRRPSRRHALGALMAGGTGLMVETDAVLAQLASVHPCAGPGSAGELLETLPLFRGRSQAQAFGVKYGGQGLDARMVTDLSLLEPDDLITPTERVFIRTEIPPAARAHRGPWLIDTTGRGADGRALTLDDLRPHATAMGSHLIECSGNANASNFGLMSVAEWDGIPLVDVVARLPRVDGAVGVLVSGVDHVGQVSERSTAGASWVFPLASLERLGAFLAVGMNGEPLPDDHGKPVRLVVPGWYGCTWIKWVNEIRFVGPDEPATSQMIEFAGRTHQTRAHALAIDYTPADIQTAATPVRVEKRRSASGIDYRIVGIVWGGTTPIEELAIRFDRTADFEPFRICPAPATHRTWSLWEYRWKPTEPGTYDIALRVPDATVPQRRLTSGYYMRQVVIEDVG